MRIDTPAEVRAAALRAVNVAGELKRFETYEAVSAQLGFSYQAYFWSAGAPAGRDERETYEGRVDRAMAWLADKSKIVRVSRGQRNQLTGRREHATGYWSLEAWKQAAATHEAQAAREADRRARWELVIARLDKLGVDCTRSTVEGPRLDFEGWDYLLTAAEAWHAANE